MDARKKSLAQFWWFIVRATVPIILKKFFLSVYRGLGDTLHVVGRRWLCNQVLMHFKDHTRLKFCTSEREYSVSRNVVPSIHAAGTCQEPTRIALLVVHADAINHTARCQFAYLQSSTRGFASSRFLAFWWSNSWVWRILRWSRPGRWKLQRYIFHGRSSATMSCSWTLPYLDLLLETLST